jgi:stage III sporulation protein AA
MYKGIPQNDVGIKTDILDSIPKSVGMKMLIRSMAPTVIAADEIGTFEDVDAINYAICCGIKGIFTAHGNNLEDLELNPALNKLIKIHMFERIICLNSKEKGKLSKVYELKKENKEYINIL